MFAAVFTTYFSGKVAADVSFSLLNKT